MLRADRADKVISFKYKPKARRRVKKGHRQEQTILRVTDVVLNGKSAAETEKVAAEARKTERERLAEAAAIQATADAALAATLATKAAAAESAEAPADAVKKPARAAAKAKTPAPDKAKPAAAKGKTPAPDTAKPAARRPRAAKKED